MAVLKRAESSAVDPTRRYCWSTTPIHDIVRFTLPDVPEGKHWLDLIDTARPESVPDKHPFGKGF